MDLLRAMLVFAGAGLDSMLKQIIRDTLPKLCTLDSEVQKGLERFAARSLRTVPEDAAGAANNRFLAAILAAGNPKAKLVDGYVSDLIGGSLQSVPELCRAMSALGVKPEPIISSQPRLAEAFRVRNRVVHELDINFEHAKRNRQTRRLKDMIGFTNAILVVATAILVDVDKRLAHEQP